MSTAIFTDRHDIHPNNPTECLLCDRTGETVTVGGGSWSGPTKGYEITFADGFESWAADAELEVIS